MARNVRHLGRRYLRVIIFEISRSSSRAFALHRAFSVYLGCIAAPNSLPSSFPLFKPHSRRIEPRENLFEAIHHWPIVANFPRRDETLKFESREIENSFLTYIYIIYNIFWIRGTV